MTSQPVSPQTKIMSHTYMKFDFGTDEEKAQLARHKLDVWKQAFRLDKKLLYKLDRGEAQEPENDAKKEAPAKAEKPKAKEKGKVAESAKKQTKETAETPDSPVSLLVRLYFSSHEKLSEQRWLDRIPTEEPFKDASPKVIHKSDAEFVELDKEFEHLE